MRIFREPHPKRLFLWACIYGIALTAFAVFVLLDAFAVSKVQATVAPADTSSITSSASSGDSSGAVGSSAQAQITATSYEDANISINISTLREYDTDIYVVDVQVSTAEYLKTALAQNAFGRNLKDTTSDMAGKSGAVLAINGDYYGFRDDGFVVRNGVLYRSVAADDTDALVVGGDGTLYSADETATDAQTLVSQGAWQVLSFGPVLVQDGRTAVGESTEVGKAMVSNPRTAIGMISPLHYVIVVSDGRTSSEAGLSLYQLAQVFEDQGCTFAYNLDGGGSSTLWFEGRVLNDPTDGQSSGEREVSDIVYIG